MNKVQLWDARDCCKNGCMSPFLTWVAERCIFLWSIRWLYFPTFGLKLSNHDLGFRLFKYHCDRSFVPETQKRPRGNSIPEIPTFVAAGVGTVCKCIHFFRKILFFLQGYGYNLNWRGWGTSEYRFTPNRPSHWSLISTGEGMLTVSRVLCFNPVKIPSPVEIIDQWDGLFGVKRYSDVAYPLQSML